MTEEIVYDCRLSSDVDDKFIADYISVANAVFHGNFVRDEFDNMYLRNIYGDSVIVVVYINGTPSAVRALWRNDIEGREAYQLCNVCVLETYRGRGIITGMTKRAMSMVNSGALFYSYPNTKAYPIYLSKGWKLIKSYYLRLLISNRKYREEHPFDADTRYVDWCIKYKPGTYYIKRGSAYYLVCKHPRPLCYEVFSRVSRSDALKFKKLSNIAFVFYNTTEKTWYNKSFVPLHVMANTDDVHYLPVWKMDSL